MTEDELSVLVQEIRNGRSESDAVDWKRKFWDLSVEESRRSFLKDVAAMANSQSHEPSRYIVLGISTSGTLSDAPLPTDEANLQQMLSAITPVPKVSFELIQADGYRLTVVEIQPPYDRPYVTRIGDQNFTWVRAGSSTITATRYILDSYYQEKRRKPSIELRWWKWPRGSERSASNEPEPLEGGLEIPAPSIRLEEVVSRLEQRAAIARDQASKTDDPQYDSRLKAFERERTKFLASLQRTDELGGWYFWTEAQGEIRFEGNDLRKTALEARYFSVELLNSGTSPATGLRLILTFPSWVLVFRNEPTLKDVNLPSIPSCQPPQPEKWDRFLDILPNPTFELQLEMLKATRAASRPQPTSRILISEADSRIEITAGQLDHRDCLGKNWRFGVIALPSMPEGVGTPEVGVEIFYREGIDWFREKKNLYVTEPLL